MGHAPQSPKPQPRRQLCRHRCCNNQGSARSHVPGEKFRCELGEPAGQRKGLRCNTRDAPRCPQAELSTTRHMLSSLPAKPPGTGPPVCREGALIPAASRGNSGRAGKCAAGKLGAAGGKAAQLPRAEPALKPHSPGTDKSYRKRGDLSQGLAWFVSARRGER